MRAPARRQGRQQGTHVPRLQSERLIQDHEVTRQPPPGRLGSGLELQPAAPVELDFLLAVAPPDSPDPLGCSARWVARPPGSGAGPPWMWGLTAATWALWALRNAPVLQLFTFPGDGAA
jgi:hypothetical protein